MLLQHFGWERIVVWVKLSAIAKEKWIEDPFCGQNQQNLLWERKFMIANIHVSSVFLGNATKLHLIAFFEVRRGHVAEF